MTPAQPIYMVVGCPASGKSWVCRQLRRQYDYLPHDDYMMGSKSTSMYVEAIKAMHRDARKPLLIETPFSVSQIKDPLEKLGFRVVPVFILEKPDTLRKRYKAREGKDIPAGHLSRQATYAQRAMDWQAFQGTSNHVLEYLKNAVPAAESAWPWE